MYDVTTLAERIETSEITTVEQYDEMAQFLVDCSVMNKEVHAEHDEGISLAHKTHKHLSATRKLKLDLIEKLSNVIKSKRLKYKTEQDEIAEKEQKILDDKEAQRVADEKEKILKLAAESDIPEERERLEEEAAQIIEQPVNAKAVVNTKQRVASGGSTTWIKDIEIIITDEKDVCKGVCEGSIPIAVIEVKATKLKAWAKATEMKPGKYRGFNINKKDRESVRS